VAAGIGWVTGGTITAHTGFSPQVSTVLLAASALTAVFLVGESVSMWRRSNLAG
jgi:hypothetical protein